MTFHLNKRKLALYSRMILCHVCLKWPSGSREDGNNKSLLRQRRTTNRHSLLESSAQVS